MNDFKLIAIRPLIGCSPALLKVLKPNQTYKFFNDYKFIYQDNNIELEVINVEYDSEGAKINDLYNIKNLKNKTNVSVNISAIVGENGSGKSSLFELIFIAVYNIAVKRKIIIDPLTNKIIEELHRGFNCELYYLTNDKIKQIRFLNDDITLTNFTNKTKDDIVNFNLHDFFYTIVTNYSLFGLNSLNLGNWIKAIYFKNDGYQTPIVINPFREDGIIDINHEIYLAKQRLLSNILRPIKGESDDFRYITEKHKVKGFLFELNNSKIEYAYKSTNPKDKEISFEVFFKKDKKELLLKSIYGVFFGSEPSDDIIYKTEIELYIIKKLIKIAQTYPKYKEHFSEFPNKILPINGKKIIQQRSRFRDFDGFLKKLTQDKSHITFKLFQAINYLKGDILRNDIAEKTIWTDKIDSNGVLKKQFEISVETLSNRIIETRTSVNKIIEVIPPSLFDIELVLYDLPKNIGLNNPSSSNYFSKLSSGEQQLIHSIQGIIYQINNIDSVFDDKSDNKISKKRIRYKYLNIMMDEIELHFHPEYQRTFIWRLLHNLKNANLNNIQGINIIFSTHSPFILSDIPDSNILMLKSENNTYVPHTEKGINQTFGANIHDLLKYEFFLNKGFMGEFAKNKIQSLITYLENRDTNEELWNQEKADKFIQIIGEPMLKEGIRRLYLNKFNTKETIKREIDRLTKELNK